MIFPVTEVIQQTPSEPVTDRGQDFLFDFAKGDFVVKDGKLITVYGDAEVVFWIEKTLRTEYERAPVYKRTGYGFGLDDFIGKVLPPEIVRLQFTDALKSALLQHQRIQSIDNVQVDIAEDYLNVSFEVTLKPLTPVVDDEFGVLNENYLMLRTVEEIQEFMAVKMLTANKLLFKTSLGNFYIRG